ncbi:MAG TPA: hypothetical protein VFB16_09235 [Bauldia sp.]|nr:hypothetical protein [Bauldia sp.]
MADMTDREKGEEILKKRRLAAKGLKERADGKPVDPLADATSLDPDDKRTRPLDPEEKEDDLAVRELPVGAAFLRNK